ncbi:hypothetical protein Bca52824_041086 [Brassica carinata]|uniref:Uncharacterized protein n=1 Tax=Brassica carinata TaxID=52824 RepID=A0A8X7RUP7_BRACI|nr:hypothetical protein Bca52824_041086 [Brassica carinata]
MGDTCRQGNGGSVLVWAKPKRIENQLFTSFSFSLAVIEYAIELSSTAHLLPADGSPPDSITEPQISSRASPLDGEVRFDHEDCISKEIKEKQPFPPHLKKLRLEGVSGDDVVELLSLGCTGGSIVGDGTGFDCSRVPSWIEAVERGGAFVG